MPACLTRRGLFVGAIAAILIVVAIVTAVTLTMNQGSSSEAESTAPVVTVEQGELSGVWVDGAQGHGFKYAAFRGVPFASPPLGKLRFKGPRPPQRYKGVLNAIHEASPCVQNFAGINGTEDCLYLNVYTPRLPKKSQITRATAMPVYFFIHGGGFIWGSSTAAEFGPDFLVSRDIVVVTIQYRLGPFGYMSLDNEEMPGNAGLKDQLAALRWVHDNIASFGGDPSKVTIGGHSAGSASAHYLTLLPAAKGLFRAAILQSGTATSSWGYTTRHKEVALAVGRELAGGRQVDEQEAARLAMQATDRELYDAAIKVTDADKKSRTGVLASDIATAFSPCPERRTPRLPDGEEVLLTQDPESYIIDKLGSDVPILMGETTQEWGIFFMQQGYINDLGQVDNAVNNLISLTPSSIFPGEATKTILGITKDVTQEVIADVVDELRHHYFDLKEDGCDKACHLLKYFHEIYMKADTSHLARLRSKYSTKPTYTYVFALFSDYNQFARATNLPEYMKDAVIHGDEQGYIWRSDRVQRQDFQGTTTASRALRRQVRWWTNFIEYSDPTPPHMGRRWQPILPLSKETHLLIGDPDEFQYRDESMDGAEDPLWTKFFARFRDNRSP